MVPITMFVKAPISKGAIREPFTLSNRSIREGLFTCGRDHPINYKVEPVKPLEEKIRPGENSLRTFGELIRPWNKGDNIPEQIGVLLTPGFQEKRPIPGKVLLRLYRISEIHQGL